MTSTLKVKCSHCKKWTEVNNPLERYLQFMKLKTPENMDHFWKYLNELTPGFNWKPMAKSKIAKRYAYNIGDIFDYDLMYTVLMQKYGEKKERKRK